MAGIKEKIEYIIMVSRHPKRDVFSLIGVSEDGLWYTNGRKSNGEILDETFWDFRSVRLEGRKGIKELREEGGRWEFIAGLCELYKGRAKICYRKNGKWEF